MTDEVTQQERQGQNQQQDDILLDVKGLKKYFPIKGGGFRRKVVAYVKAVDDLDFFVKKGETLGLVGESGCGKTTAGRAILRLYEPTAGEVYFRSRTLSGNGDPKMVNLGELNKKQLKLVRQDISMIFQDPINSLNPRMTVYDIITEPLVVHNKIGPDTEDTIKQLLVRVGMRPEHIRDFNLSYIFVAHDLSVVQHISDRVAVMYVGRIMEMADAMQLYSSPKHPYTEALMSSVPVPNPHHIKDRILMKGDVADPADPPSGCLFHPRCRYAKDICETDVPELREVEPDRWAACHLVDELELQGV
jgi:oligopeptide/dipeptide ABC transporter ATP-binding protein